MIHLQQTREELYKKTQVLQEKMKNIFDRGPKQENFQINDLVLKLDSRYEDKGKHIKFDHLWKVPFQIAPCHESNTFILKNLQGEWAEGGPVNGLFLQIYII